MGCYGGRGKTMVGRVHVSMGYFSSAQLRPLPTSQHRMRISIHGIHLPCDLISKPQTLWACEHSGILLLSA